MPELSRVRPESDASLTQGRLWVLVGVSVCMAATTFVLGLQVGRQQVPVLALPPRDALISEEARTGNLEVLLQKVSASERESHLEFPAELRVSPPPPAEPVIGPDGLPVAVEAPPPATALVPPAPKEGSAEVTTLGGTDILGVSPTNGYAVQVAVTDVKGAAAVLGALTAQGVDGYAIDAVVDGQPERRVRVGGYATEAAAAAAVPGLAQVVGAQLSASNAVVKAP
jgi:hypothetical protein